MGDALFMGRSRARLFQHRQAVGPVAVQRGRNTERVIQVVPILAVGQPGKEEIPALLVPVAIQLLGRSDMGGGQRQPQRLLVLPGAPVLPDRITESLRVFSRQRMIGGQQHLACQMVDRSRKGGSKGTL